MQLKSRGVLFDAQAAQNVSFLWPGNQTTLAVPNASRGFKLDISQPLLNQVRCLKIVPISSMKHDAGGAAADLWRVQPSEVNSRSWIICTASHGSKPVCDSLLQPFAVFGSPPDAHAVLPSPCD